MPVFKEKSNCTKIIRAVFRVEILTWAPTKKEKWNKKINSYYKVRQVCIFGSQSDGFVNENLKTLRYFHVRSDISSWLSSIAYTFIHCSIIHSSQKISYTKLCGTDSVQPYGIAVRFFSLSLCVIDSVTFKFVLFLIYVRSLTI